MPDREVPNFACRIEDTRVLISNRIVFLPPMTRDCSSEAATVARLTVFRHVGEIMRFGGRKTPKEKNERRQQQQWRVISCSSASASKDGSVYCFFR